MIAKMLPILSIFSVFWASTLQAVTLTPVSDTLNKPWGLAFISPSEALVTEKNGKLYRVDLNDGQKTQVQGLPEIKIGGQGGLLDVIVEGDTVYMCYVKPNGRLAQTAIFKAKLADARLLDGSTIWAAEPPVSSGAHFGCRLGRDPQGYVYASSGERRSRALVQDPSNEIGAVVRLHPDGSVPLDNPFYPSATYSYGHRNPQGMAIHPLTGRVWTHEHGPKGGDEVNVSEAGSNHGWPLVSYGEEYYGADIGSGATSMAGVKEPLWYWTPSIAPSGMTFNGPTTLFVGALKYEMLVKLKLDGERVISQEVVFEGDLGRIRDVERAPDGKIYVIQDSPTARIWRVDF